MAQAKRKPAPMREQLQEQLPAQEPAPESRQVREAVVQGITAPLLVTCDLNGTTVDVGLVPVATAMDVINIGTFAQRIAYNLLADKLNPEIRDTTYSCWSDVPKTLVNAFRKCRDYADKNGPGSLRNKWAAYVAEKAGRKEEAEAAGKKSGIRIRKPSLSGIAMLIKGNAPKGGGIAGLKLRIREQLLKVFAALNVPVRERNEKSISFHLNAALAFTEAGAVNKEAVLAEKK